MDYESAKNIRDYYQKQLDLRDKELKKICGNNEGGLTPDHIKESSEYKVAKALFDLAFKELRDFNAKFVKNYKKEIRKELVEKRK